MTLSREIVILSGISFPVYGLYKIAIAFALWVAIAGNIGFEPNRSRYILDVKQES